jgi:SAM-dependent methyltransferase
VLDDIIMSDSKVFRADLARSVRLFRASRTEQAAPEAYYTALAQDTILQLRQYTELDGRIVIDVGGGPGFFVRELNRMGARSFCVDADSGEMAALGPPEGGIVASATRMPIASGAVDVCFSSNVLEHVKDWPAMLTEMVRVTRAGGIVFVTFTNWLSPYGGHETSPWHYLGGERAVARYQRNHGKMPKNRFGHSLHPVSVAEVLGWARSAQDAVVIDAVPRYLPGWTRPLVRVPLLREFLTWNLLLVLRRRLAPVGASAAAPRCRRGSLVRRVGGGFWRLPAGRRGHFGGGSFGGGVLGLR